MRFDLHAARLADDRVGLEGSDAAHDAEVGAVPRVMPGGEVGHLAPGKEEGAEVAKVLLAHRAGRAAPARGDEAQHHVVSGSEGRDVRSDLHDFSRAFVPADDRQLF